ncbi:MAG: ATP-binding protein [Planctomycetes bacterium]|nr:ATP-binding protein [Planctomycetota bacterium]
MLDLLTRLQPHRPLDGDEDAYVERAEEGGNAIAAWVRAGRSSLLVLGPAGIGKSTELARAARDLQPDRFTCLIPLDRFENVRLVTPERALLRIAALLVQVAGQGLPGFSPSRDLSTAIHGPEPGVYSFPPPPVWDADTALRVACREVAGASKQGRVCLLVDGLEKAPESTFWNVADALGHIAPEVDLIVVIPWYVAYGQRTGEVLRPDEKLFAIHPVVVTGELGVPGRRFLQRLLGRHFAAAGGIAGLLETILDKPSPDPGVVELRGVFNRAIDMSGGIPRTYLQLIVDATMRAKFRSHDQPRTDDLDDAVADQRDSFRRLLSAGDEVALRDADGTDGRDLEWQQKIRLLNHGMLIESQEAGKPVLHIHPIIRDLLE